MSVYPKVYYFMNRDLPETRDTLQSCTFCLFFLYARKTISLSEFLGDFTNRRERVSNTRNTAGFWKIKLKHTHTQHLVNCCSKRTRRHELTQLCQTILPHSMRALKRCSSAEGLLDKKHPPQCELYLSYCISGS